MLRDALGYDPNPGLVVVVRAPDGGKLDVAEPRGAAPRSPGSAARSPQVEYVGRVVNPLRDRRAGATLIARDGESLVIAGHLSTDDIEDAGGYAAEDVGADRRGELARRRDGRLRAGFNETNDQTRKDLTKAELIAFPILALLLLFVFRGVVAASIPLLIGVISIVGTFLVLRVMSELRRHLAVRAQHRHRAQPRPRGRLRAADGLALPRGDRRAAAPRARRTAARCRRPGAPRVFSGLTVAVAMAALVVMPQRFLYSMAVAGAAVGAALGGDRDPRRPLAAGPARHAHRRALDPPRRPPSPTTPTAGTGSPAG